jgi:hypothetical protein
MSSPYEKTLAPDAIARWLESNQVKRVAPDAKMVMWLDSDRRGAGKPSVRCEGGFPGMTGWAVGDGHVGDAQVKLLAPIPERPGHWTFRRISQWQWGVFKRPAASEQSR